MRRAILIVISVVAGLGHAYAQATPATPLMGSRIRIAVSHDLDRAGQPVGELRELTGTVSRIDRDSVVLVSSGRDIAAAVTHVFQMEIVEGRKTRAVPVAIGVAIPGALVGALAGGFAACPLLATTCHNQVVYGITGLLAGGLAGAAVGGVIGSLFHVDRWVNVPANTFRIAVVPGRSRLSAKLGASF
jgi:hypothetical protein